MSRAYGKVYKDIWSDEDFLDLEAGPQRLYLALLTEPSLNAAGVASVTLRRWASRAKGYTVDALRTDLATLAERRFVVIDEDTEELLIRTFVRNDEIWRIPNTLYAVVRDARTTASPVLREVLAEELAKLPVDELSGKKADSMREQVSTVIATLRTTVRRTLGARVTATHRQLFGEPKSQPVGAGAGVGEVVKVSDTSLVENGAAPPTAPPRAESETKKNDPPRADVERLCGRLVEHLVRNGALKRDAKVTKTWRDEARRLVDLDGVPLGEALRVLDWCQRDSFWCKNVLSIPTFRKQYSQLRMKAREARAIPPDKPEQWDDRYEETTGGWDV